MASPAVLASRPTPTALSVAARYAVVGAVAVGLAAVHLPRRPPTLCLLRELTGVPCPFCGGTTAAVRLGHADVRGALSASPLAVLMLGTWPLLGRVRAPSWWRSRKVRWSSVALILVAAEVWQLLRFGLLGV